MADRLEDAEVHAISEEEEALQLSSLEIRPPQRTSFQFSVKKTPQTSFLIHKLGS